MPTIICSSVTSTCLFFFFNDTATTEIYTLSLHDALPISARSGAGRPRANVRPRGRRGAPPPARSEEHTSELQSRPQLVCRLLLEKNKEYEMFERVRARTLAERSDIRALSFRPPELQNLFFLIVARPPKISPFPNNPFFPF